MVKKKKRKHYNTHRNSVSGGRSIGRKRAAGRRRENRANRHHVLFERSMWQGEDYEAMRGDPLMIITLDQRVHEILHFEDVVPPVPPPGRSVARAIRNEFVRLRSRCNWVDRGGLSYRGDAPGITIMCRAIDAVTNPRLPVGGHRLSQLERSHLELIKSNILTQQLFAFWDADLMTLYEYGNEPYSWKVPAIEKVAQMSGDRIISLLESRYGSAQRRMLRVSYSLF